MSGVYVIGASTTRFQRWPERSYADLTREVVEGALVDSGLGSAAEVESVAFGSCAMAMWGQPNVRGPACLHSLVEDGMLPPHVPITDLEGGCATGSLALLSAFKDVASGLSGLSLAVGVDKTFKADDPGGMMALFAGAMVPANPEAWLGFYCHQAEGRGLYEMWQPHPHRITLLDVCALQAADHMQTHGTTVEQIAASAAKNHDHGALNPKAQYQVSMTVEQVLADKHVVGPLTRAMCAPIGDGAAAVLLCSAQKLSELPAAVGERAIQITGVGQSSGTWRPLGQPGPARLAARKAFSMAGQDPMQVDLVELHDATSFAEISLSEDLGFCEPGQGGAYVASGAATLGGRRPANTSGGLVSKGHPLAASGIAMAHELTTQLRGEAGDRQVGGAQTGLLQNGGGMVGFDEAASCAIIFSR
jgi:acetyl-CoA acetyltransferase